MTKAIRFVKEHTVDGNTYCWFVKFRDNTAMEYADRDERGRVFSDKAFEAEYLPKYIQRYINSHRAVLFSQMEYGDGQIFTTYIYQ